jgi:predicted SAM-dependent methyltransferase
MSGNLDLPTFARIVNALARRVLKNPQLLEPSGEVRWHRKRRFGRLDRQLVEQYLRQSQVQKLHIGCGGNLLPGWLNADFLPESRDVLHIDATKPFLFPNDAFDYVFSEHMIEHISYHHGVKMLEECRRVLNPDGKIRISTPDLAFLVNLYREDKSPLQTQYINWAARTFIPGVPAVHETFVINNFVRDWGHTFIYDEITLRTAMMRAGFVNIVRCDLQESEDPALCNLENETRMPPGFLRLETLTLEGEVSELIPAERLTRV